MKISYLEDRGLKLVSKEKSLSTPYVKRPPKLDRSNKSNYDSSSEEKSPMSLMGSCDTLSQSFFDNSSTSWSSFTVLGTLGEGSFGKVYKARFHIDQKIYAVKVDKSPVRSDAHRKFKLSEVKRHEELSHHPNIVRLHHAWEERRIIYIQLELCETSLQTLSHKVKQIPETQIWDVLVDMLSALQYIHGLDLIHLDVKLENILVGFDGRYKLSDFGLVHNITNSNENDPREGDAKYLAPEVLDNKFTTAADIFSLGISILELAANVVLPNQGPAWQELRRDRLPRTQTAYLSMELMTVIAWMMASDFIARPSADQLLQHSFLLPRIKSRNKMLLFRDIRHNLMSVLNFIIFNPLKKIASACFRAVSCLFAAWMPHSKTMIQPPLIQIHEAGTPSEPNSDQSSSRKNEIVHSSPLEEFMFNGTPSASSCKSFSRRRPAVPNSVRRNLLSSFSSSDSDE